jgi:hypothetical protein
VDFPTTAGAYRVTPAGQEDAFIVKLNAAGSGLLYSTLLGGTGADFATGIAVDSAGNAYLSGYTSSLAFPATANAFQRSFAGGWQDAFAAKLNTSSSGLDLCHIFGRARQRSREWNPGGSGRLHRFIQFSGALVRCVPPRREEAMVSSRN